MSKQTWRKIRSINDPPFPDQKPYDEYHCKIDDICTIIIYYYGKQMGFMGELKLSFRSSNESTKTIVFDINLRRYKSLETAKIGIFKLAKDKLDNIGTKIDYAWKKL